MNNDLVMGILFVVNLCGFIYGLRIFRKNKESMFIVAAQIITGSAIGMGLTAAYLFTRLI
jgi:hypothetical protein